MDRAGPPLVEVSRPALSLVDTLGYQKRSVSFEAFQRAARRPRTTVTRYLKQLTDAWLILRVRQGEYAIPERSTFGQLLLEPSSYRRSLLLYRDILHQRGEGPLAVACLPIRDIFQMEIDRVIPVLPPDDRLKDPARAPPYAEVLWYPFQAERVAETDLSERWAVDRLGTVPTLEPEISLALLTATLDPRYMTACKAAAERLGLAFPSVVKLAKHLSPQAPPLDAIRPNTVVFPGWLRGFWETAKTQHARHALDGFLQQEKTDSPGSRVGTDA